MKRFFALIYFNMFFIGLVSALKKSVALFRPKKLTTDRVEYQLQ